MFFDLVLLPKKKSSNGRAKAAARSRQRSRGTSPLPPLQPRMDPAAKSRVLLDSAGRIYTLFLFLFFYSSRVLLHTAGRSICYVLVMNKPVC
jgi:hypothetical protein